MIALVAISGDFRSDIPGNYDIGDNRSGSTENHGNL